MYCRDANTTPGLCQQAPSICQGKIKVLFASSHLISLLHFVLCRICTFTLHLRKYLSLIYFFFFCNFHANKELAVLTQQNVFMHKLQWHGCKPGLMFWTKNDHLFMLIEMLSINQFTALYAISRLAKLKEQSLVKRSQLLIKQRKKKDWNNKLIHFWCNVFKVFWGRNSLLSVNADQSVSAS